MGAQRLDRRTLSKARPEALRRLARRMKLDVGGCGCNECDARIVELLVRELDRQEMKGSGLPAIMRHAGRG